MNFLKLRPDIHSLQIFGFFAIIFWSVTGNPNLAAGFGLLFTLVGFGVTQQIREARANTELFNPLTYFIDASVSLFLKLHIVVAAGIVWIIATGPQLKDIWLQSAFNMSIGVGNWQQISRPENYFSPDSQLSPFVHMWVIALAIQLIAILTFLGFIMSLIKFDVPLVLKRVLVLTLYVSSFYLMFSFYSNATNTTGFFLSTWSWLWAFVLGIALAYTDIRLPASKVNAIAGDIAFVLVAGVLVLALFNITVITTLYFFLIVVLLALVVLLSKNETMNFRILSSNYAQKLADISLSVFLWSWPLTQFAKNFFGLELLSLPQTILVLSLSLVLGALTHVVGQFISDTLSNLANLRQWTSKIAVLAIVPIVLLALQTPVANDVSPDPQESITFTPSLDEVANDVPDYLANPECTKNSTKCMYGKSNSDTHVILYGSSLSGNWQPALAEIAEQENWKLEVRINPDCPSFERTKKCDLWLEKTKDYILTSKPDLVVSNFGLIGTRLSVSPNGEGNLGDVVQELLNYEVKTWIDLLKSGVRVAVLRGSAIFQEDPVQCLESSPNFLKDCAFEKSIGYVSDDQLERSLQLVTKDLQIFDLTNEFCDGNLCRVATSKGVVIYRDSTHVTKTFSLSLVKILKPLLVNALTLEINTRPLYCLPEDSRPECS